MTDEERVVAAAISLMDGNECAANAWLSKRRAIFGQKTALELANEGNGDTVLALIGRIRHGVFS